MKKVSICLIVLIFVIIFSISPVYADNSTEKEFSVNYISKYYSDKQFKDKESFFTKISNFIFGAKLTRLIKPMNIVMQNKNVMLVLDQGSKSIIKIDYSSSKFKTIENNFNLQFPSLIGICLYENNDILFTDSALDKIFQYSDSSSSLIEFKTSVELKQPTGIAYLPQNKEIWVCETAGHCILVFNRQGELQKTIGKRGTGPGKFNFPNFIWIDENGIVYIIDSMNYRLQILDSNGEVISVFGEQGDVSGFFAAPKGVATDSFGHIYIVDALFHTVQVFNKDGKYLYNFGKQGHNDGEFFLPVGIFIDRNNRIYVSDSYNSRVQVFQLIHEDLNE